MSGSLCDALTGGINGHNTLLTLERANLFLIPVDASGLWFRYHQLFRDLLQHQLEQEVGKETLDELHRRASAWFEGNGLLEEAIDHALAAREWHRAMALIRDPAVMERRLRTLTLLSWLRRVPERVLRTDLALYHNYAWALLAAGDYRAVEDCLIYLDTVAHEDGLIEGKIAVIRSTVAFNRGNISLAEQHARGALSLLSDSGELPQDYQGHLGVVCLLLAGIHISRVQYSEAEPLLRQSLPRK